MILNLVDTIMDDVNLKNYTELKSRFVDLRRTTGLSVRSLAKELGVTSSYIYGIEAGDKQSISETLAELIELKFNFSKKWILDGTGPTYSTSTSPEAENASAPEIIRRGIERTERVLEIVYGRKDTTGVKADYLARFTDGSYLLIGAMIHYNDEAPPLEVRDIRGELADRGIHLYQLRLDERWYADYTVYPKREKLEALFFRPDVGPIKPQKSLGSLDEIKKQAPWVLGKEEDHYFEDSEAEEAGILKLLSKTADVLKSKTVYRTALKSNINAFHQSIRTEEELSRMTRRMDDFEHQTHQKIDELAQLIKGLQEENRLLKQSGSLEEGLTPDASSSTDQPSGRKTT